MWALKLLKVIVMCTASVVDLNEDNLNIMDDTQVFIVNFYADWCRFSRQLHPIFEDAEKLIRPSKSSIFFGDFTN